MAKLKSVPLYPVNITASGVPVNLVKNRTPEGKWQIAKPQPGGPEGEVQVLWEGDSEWEADAFSTQQIEKDYPGLMSQRG